MNDKTFVYGDRHFTPIQKFEKQDGDTVKISQKLRSDSDLETVNRSHTDEDFYAMAPDKCSMYPVELTIPKRNAHRKNRFDETYKQEGTDTYESVLRENILKNGPNSDLYVWIYHQYKQSFDWGNARLNLHKIFNPDHVKDVAAILKENHIQAFTFSADWSGAIDIAWLFTQNGYVLKGMVTILNPTDIKTVVPAYLFVKETL